jgi:hypothetical protein
MLRYFVLFGAVTASTGGIEGIQVADGTRTRMLHVHSVVCACACQTGNF